MISHKERQQKYGTLVREPTIIDQDDEYELRKAHEPWSTAKMVAVSGFILIQLALTASILNQIFFASPQITPEQLHLSLGQNDNEYYVSWATTEPAQCQLIWRRLGSSTSRFIRGEMVEALYEDREEDRSKLFNNSLSFSETTYRKYFYNAKMTVTPGATYEYYVVSKLEQRAAGNKRRDRKETLYLSKHYSFIATNFDDPKQAIHLLFYGDLGLKNGQSVPRLLKEVLNPGSIDLIIHNGDFAYDLNTKRGRYGDEFMRLMEPIAARVPYQTSVGNHEAAQNFSHYDKRFKMINRGPIQTGRTNNYFYSFNAGPVHFVAISTEFYYFLDYVGLAPLVNQFEWLKADLAKANEPSERAKRPWLVVFGHRPMYCSSRDHDDCSKDSNLLRHGLPFTGAYALEKLFYEQSVDLELYSHEHQYERFLPIYNSQVYNGTSNNPILGPYHNARAPVHLISGSAGCSEKLDPFSGQPTTGSVRQLADYGYTKIRATRCALYLQQVSDDKAGTVVDKFIISKDRQNFPPGTSPINYEYCSAELTHHNHA